MTTENAHREPHDKRQSPLERLGGKGVAAIGLGVLALVFIGENTQRTKIRFIIPSLSAPLWLALLLAAAVGGVIGGLVVHRRSR